MSRNQSFNIRKQLRNGTFAQLSKVNPNYIRNFSLNFTQSAVIDLILLIFRNVLKDLVLFSNLKCPSVDVYTMRLSKWRYLTGDCRRQVGGVSACADGRERWAAFGGGWGTCQRRRAG